MSNKKTVTMTMDSDVWSQMQATYPDQVGAIIEKFCIELLEQSGNLKLGVQKVVSQLLTQKEEDLLSQISLRGVADDYNLISELYRTKGKQLLPSEYLQLCDDSIMKRQKLREIMALPRVGEVSQ
jgi:hypothetical protein